MSYKAVPLYQYQICHQDQKDDSEDERYNQEHLG